MALPVDVGQGIVRVRLRQLSVVSQDDANPDVLPVTGRVNFTPTVSTVRHEGLGLMINTRRISVVLDSNGDADVVLMATNDPQIIPTGFTYEVSFDLDESLALPAFHISVPEGSDRELSDLAPVEANGGVYYLSSTVAVSTDAGNTATLGSDGRIYVPDATGATATAADVRSTAAGNYIIIDGTGKLYAPTPVIPPAPTPSSFLSTNAGNYATIGTDSKIFVPTPSGGGSVVPSTLVSAQSGNTLTVGSDSKLYNPTPPAPVLAHSGLTGLTTGDDHTQYLNTTRGDARYYTKGQTYSAAEVDVKVATVAAGADDVKVVLYAGGAYEDLPASPNAGWRVIEYRGPTVPTPPTSSAYANIQFDWRVRG